MTAFLFFIVEESAGPTHSRIYEVARLELGLIVLLLRQLRTEKAMGNASSNKLGEAPLAEPTTSGAAFVDKALVAKPIHKNVETVFTLHEVRKLDSYQHHHCGVSR